MTESEWLAGNDPQPMLLFLRGKVSSRKLRLFACTCCRSIWHLLTNNAGRDAINVAEHHADGLASDRERTSVLRRVSKAWTSHNEALPEAYQKSDAEGDAGGVLVTAIDGARACVAKDAFEAAYEGTICAAHAVGRNAATVGTSAKAELVGREKQYAHQTRLLRDVIGNPFRPTKINPAWLTPTVTNLAQAAYDERILPSGELDRERLAILSDALEEAGCDDGDILNHLRSPGPHVRGCWAVDLLLGRS